MKKALLADHACGRARFPGGMKGSIENGRAEVVASWGLDSLFLLPTL